MLQQNIDMALTSPGELFMIALLWTWASVNISYNLFAPCNRFDLSLSPASSKGALSIGQLTLCYLECKTGATQGMRGLIRFAVPENAMCTTAAKISSLFLSMGYVLNHFLNKAHSFDGNLVYVRQFNQRLL